MQFESNDMCCGLRKFSCWSGCEVHHASGEPGLHQRAGSLPPRLGSSQRSLSLYKLDSAPDAAQFSRSKLRHLAGQRPSRHSAHIYAHVCTRATKNIRCRAAPCPAAEVRAAAVEALCPSASPPTSRMSELASRSAAQCF